MIAIPQSVTSRIVLKAYLSSDHVSAATGKTLAVVISKNGASFVNPSAGATNATEIGNGWYYVDLSTTDTATQGPVIIRGTSSGVDDVETYRQVVDAHNAGFDGVPSAVAAATGGLPTVDASNAVKVQSGTGANQLSLSSGTVTVGTNSDKTGYSLSVTPPTAVQIRTEMDSNSTKLANLDATVSSRSTYAGGAVASVTAAVSLSPNDSPVVQSGTAQGGAGSTITLSSGASATDNLYNGQTVKTTGGAGPSQVRVIIGYVGSTKVATVDRAWATSPDATTTYAVLATDQAKTNSSLEVVSASVTGAVGSVTGSVGSVSGAVASVTGNVGGNVVGSVASVTADVGITQTGADKVWSTTTRALTDKIGFALSSAGVQAIWDALTSALTTVGSIGKLIVTNLDALVSSRSTYAGADTAGTTTLLGRLTTTRSANLDNLDAAISSRSTYAGGAVASVTAAVTVGTNNDKTGYSLTVTPPTAVQVRQEMDLNSTKLANLDAAVSTRSTYTGADTSGTTTLLGRLTSGRSANLDNLDAAISTRSFHSAADVWAVTTRTLSSFGTLVSDTTSGVWGAASRTLSAFGFSVTAATVSDKTGYSLTTAYDPAKTASQAGDAMTLTGAYDAAKTALPSLSYTAPDNTSITAIKAKTDNLPAAPAATSDIPTAIQNADALLKRDWTSVTGEAARSVLNALRFVRNKWSISGSTMIVTKEDDATSAWTAAISTNASQDPVSGADPN